MAMSMPQGVPLRPLVVDRQRVFQLGARVVMCITRATLQRHGRDGEMAVRMGLRAPGEWRGREMHNLITCRDSAPVFIVEDREHTRPEYKRNAVRFDGHLCPPSEVWTVADFHRWGHVYRDEFHQACASGVIIGLRATWRACGRHSSAPTAWSVGATSPPHAF